MTNGEWHGYSRADQERQGLVPARRGQLVLPDSGRGEIKPLPPHNVTLAVNHSATQEVISTTSATDQARGFQIKVTPISIMFGLVAVLVFLAFDNDLFTLWSLLVFFGVYAAVYVVALVLSAFQSAEYTSYRSMNRQWDVIEAEQKERWEYYKWQDGRTKAVSEKLAGNNGLLQEVFPFFLVGSIAGLVLAIAYLIWG